MELLILIVALAILGVVLFLGKRMEDVHTLLTGLAEDIEGIKTGVSDLNDQIAKLKDLEEGDELSSEDIALLKKIATDADTLNNSFATVTVPTIPAPGDGTTPPTIGDEPPAGEEAPEEGTGQQ